MAWIRQRVHAVQAVRVRWNGLNQSVVMTVSLTSHPATPDVLSHSQKKSVLFYLSRPPTQRRNCVCVSVCLSVCSPITRERAVEFSA